MHITQNLNGLAENCLLQSQWVVKKNSASVHLHAKLSLQGTGLRNYESSGFGKVQFKRVFKAFSGK